MKIIKDTKTCVMFRRHTSVKPQAYDSVFCILASCIHRGSYTRGHFIRNLLNGSFCFIFYLFVGRDVLIVRVSSLGIYSIVGV